MAKNGGGIDIDLVASTQTDEKNGVEIKVQINYISDYEEALSKLSYIPNLYVRCEGLSAASSYTESCLQCRIEDFNNRKILSYKTFKHNTNVGTSRYKEGKVILGNIIYPVDLVKVVPISTFPNVGAEELRLIFSYLQLPFEIGSLDVTPNREALLYSQRTIEALKRGYEAALNEIKELYIQFLKENTNILNYYSQCKNGSNLPLSGDGVDVSVSIPDVACKNSLVFKGKHISDEVLEGLDHFLYMSLDKLPISFIAERGKGTLNSYWKKKKSLRELFFGRRYTSRTSMNKDIAIVKIGSKESVKSALVRSYAINKYKDSNKYTIFIPSYSFRELVNLCKRDDFFKTYNFKGTYNKIWLLKEVVRAFSDYIIEDDIENSEEFIQWKEDRKQALKNNRTTSFDKPILGYVYTDRYYSQKMEFKSLDEFHGALKRYTNLDEKERNRPVIYGELHNKYWDIFEELAESSTLDRFIRVKTAQSNMKYFKDISSKWIYIEDYLPKMKEFKLYLTYRKYHNEELDKIVELNTYCMNFLDKIRSCVIEKDAKAIKLCKNYHHPIFASSDVNVLNEILKKYKETEKTIYDDELKNAYPIYYKYVRLYEKINNIIPLFNSSSMLGYFLMKHKILRMDFSKYIDLKDKLKIIVE